MDKVTYLRNENLPTIKPGFPGNKVINGQFANGEELFQPSFRNVLKWKLAKNPQAEEKRRDTFSVPVRSLPAGTFSARNDTIIWLGHATFFIRLNGVTFLTDPVLYDLPFMKRKSALPCPPENITNIDYLLLSHGHRDHLDEKSIKVLVKHNPQMKALAPLKMTPLLKKFAPKLEVEEAGWFQQFSPISGVEVFYLPARHWHRRGLGDMNQVLWGSFLLRAGSKSIYFAADTAVGSHFQEIKELLGEPDYCLMPVGAYKPAFMMHQSHVSPQESVAAFRELGGKNFIPMHYGTFDLSDEPAGEPVRLLQEMNYANQVPGKLIIPAVGAAIPI